MTADKTQTKKPQLTYSRYLRIGELLELQQPKSDPPAHDEMLFIVIHQAYELWFKQVLFELEALLKHLDSDNFIVSFRILDRVSEIFKVLIQQIDILETMTPVEFNRFRAHLNPASGFQSFQFRELELIAGADPAEYERFFELEPEWKARLKARSAKPTLRSAFTACLKRSGMMTDDSPESFRKAILAAYSDDFDKLPMQKLCELLIRFDEQISLWRFRHVQMVERMIGMKSGTGGSLGVPYLKTTLRTRFFPELWEARTYMDGSGYGS